MSPEIGGGALEGALAAAGTSAADSLLLPQPANPAITAVTTTTFKNDDVMGNV
jgi:hypothetical protein